MTREDGIKQIDETQWELDEFSTMHLYVNTESDRPVDAWLTMRPPYCDRGHVMLNIDGPLELDPADRFPRYFFSFEEADRHTRNFLKWRMWKERTNSYDEIRSAFKKQENQG